MSPVMPAEPVLERLAVLCLALLADGRPGLGELADGRPGLGELAAAGDGQALERLAALVGDGRG